MKVLALIPARGGSKGIARKNIATLGGKPLIAWTIEAARGAARVDRVVVSTDDADIAAVARDAGAEVPFLRPAAFADDTAPALPVIVHAVHWLQSYDGWSADAIAYLQPTSPFRDAEDIGAAIALLDTPAADTMVPETVVSIVAVPHNMNPSSLMRWHGDWLEFAAAPADRQFRRQAKQRMWARNGPAILLNRRHVIEAGDLYGARIAGYEMPRLASLDIDEPQDLAIAEALLALVLARRSGTNH